MIPADYFFWFLAGIIVGIALGSYFALSPVLLAMIVALATFFIFLALRERKIKVIAIALVFLGILIGIFRAEAFLSSSQQVSYSGSAVSALVNLRDRFEYALNRALPEPEASLASGIILGKIRKFPLEFEEALRRTSTLHLVAVSGYNITIVASGILWILGLLTIHRKLAWWLAVGGIILFTLFVGAPASAVRAAIMGFLVLLAKRFGRASESRTALTLAAAGMLLWDPTYFRGDLGFQLSFLAVFGIIYLSPIILSKISQAKEPPKTFIDFKSLLADTFSAQIMVAPWILYKFGTFSLIGFLANALVLPVIPAAMFLAFLTGLGGLFLEILGQIVALFAFPVFHYVVRVIEIASNFSFASLTVENPSFWWVVLLYALIWFSFFRRVKNV